MPGVDNLNPIKPGEVRNPNGVNQYTYRRDAERHLDKWCKTHGRALVRKIADEARKGRPWAAKLILDRVLPAVERHEHQFIDDPEEAALADTVADLARRRRANGSGRGADAEAAEGPRS